MTYRENQDCAECGDHERSHDVGFGCRVCACQAFVSIGTDDSDPDQQQPCGSFEEDPYWSTDDAENARMCRSCGLWLAEHSVQAVSGRKDVM